MKNYLILFFLLVSSAAFSQNYFYALDEPKASDTEAPSAPIDLVVINIDHTTVDLSWTEATDNIGVVNYKVLIYDRNDVLLKSTTIGNFTTHTEIDLLPDTIYNVTVRAIDAAFNESDESNIVTFAMKAHGPNMVEEDLYFDCYLLPLSQKDQLQDKLNEYGCVRLEKGNYGRVSGTPVTISSNQSIYGHPEITLVPDIIVASGSTNVHLESITPLFIDFNAGAPITNSLFKHIKYATLRSTGGMLEDNLFVNLNSQVNFDMSSSGYYRNNRIIRHQVHTSSPQLVLKGNNSTPSTGNIGLWSNYLTANGDAAILENMGDITFMGIDAEGWNIRNESTTGALFYASGMGNIKISDFIGGGNYSTDPKPAWDIEANNLVLFNKAIWSGSTTDENVARSGTNVFSLQNGGKYDVVSATDVRVHTRGESATYDDYSAYVNGAKQTATITNQTTINNIKDIILDTPYMPIARPVHETLPDPLGPNWDTERLGKQDSSAYIQNLIDTNTIADLPEGVFYISSTLTLNAATGVNQGIIGQGTGKTVICGLTDDFPLITVIDNTNIESKINLANLTLQGGSAGLYFDTNIRLAAFNTWKYVIFRNQNYGVYIDKIFGFDNNNFDHLSFVNCGIGFFNDFLSQPGKGTSGYDDWLRNNLGYVDKTVFYKSQFINCDIGAQVTAGRACNLNLWLDCNFDNNRLPLDVSGNRHSMIVNCDFKNNTGGTNNQLIEAGDIGIYSCDFWNNTTANVFRARKISAEGCNFLDSSNFASSNLHFDQDHYVYNCVSNGSYGGGWRYNYGAIVNSTFANNPEYSKLLVSINQNVITTIIDEPSTPYPQFYVKH